MTDRGVVGVAVKLYVGWIANCGCACRRWSASDGTCEGLNRDWGCWYALRRWVGCLGVYDLEVGGFVV